MRGRVLMALGILCLVWSAKAKADDAYAYCPVGEGYVYLYDSPANFQVIAYLKCGDKVDVLSTDNTRARVRTADGKEGYVQQSSLSTSVPAKFQPQQQVAAAPVVVNQHPQPAATAFTPFSGFGFGPTVPLIEVYGGYSYMNAGTSALASRQSLSGFESSAEYNVNRWMAAEANFGGYYKSIDIIGVGTYAFHDYTIMGGPRFNIRKAFFHGLVGVDHLGGSTNFYAPGSTASDNTLAAAMGGGVQWKVSRHIAVRTSADYVISRFEGLTQSNFRVTAGVVFEEGSLRSRGVQVGQK